MKFLSLLSAGLGLLLATSTGIHAEEAATASATADQDRAAMNKIWGAKAPEGLSARDTWKWRDTQMQKYFAAAKDFAKKHPQDPERYNGWVQSSFTRPYFITGFKPEFDAQPRETNLIVDEEALDAFYAEEKNLLSEVIVAPDAEERQRGGAIYALMINTRAQANRAGQTFDPEQYRPLVDRAVEALGDARALPVVEVYADTLRQKSPAKADAFLGTLDSHPKLAQAIKAREETRRQAEAAAAAKRIGIATMHFTAADGRDVDLSKLRGKVVLIDFWATWCGPCVAEIPNVVANYQKYHDRGFEVVGITLENSMVKPTDDPATKEAKLAAAKRKMLAFTVSHHMPWPQYFDGKWWQNDYAERYDIKLIPAMFLLDQNGKIVSTEARGPKLEAEIKRLLAL